MGKLWAVRSSCIRLFWIRKTAISHVPVWAAWARLSTTCGGNGGDSIDGVVVVAFLAFLGDGGRMGCSDDFFVAGAAFLVGAFFISIFPGGTFRTRGRVYS